MRTNLPLQFEQAIRLLAENLPPSDQTSRKPVLFHSIQVGMYLYERGYSQDIVLAGLLHDVIEWAEINNHTLKNNFGANVARLVAACTKDVSIADKDDNITELIQRCVQTGQDALIVKTADILDSFQWYTQEKNEKELQYCQKNAAAILKLKPTDFDDTIFNELQSWQEKF